MELKPEIKKVLTEMNFIKRYEKLSDESRNKVTSDDADYIPIKRLIEIFNSFGYDAVYYKKEKFFKVGVVEKLPTYGIWFNIALHSGAVELIWTAYHNNEVRLGSPWNMYPRLLISLDYRVEPPLYSTEFELTQVLRVAFEMYEDFKARLIAEYEAMS